MTYIEQLTARRTSYQTEWDSLQTAMAANVGPKPSYGNGPRSVQWTPELDRMQRRQQFLEEQMQKLTEQIATLMPDEISTSVRAL